MRGDDIPIACTLDVGAMPDRLTEWRTVLAQVRSRSTTADGALRAELDDGIDIAELARLVVAEQQCCSFFSFAITVDARGIALEVNAPEGATDVVASLFGQPA
jgi:hypothetical protein